jgi:riboflavin synthase
VDNTGVVTEKYMDGESLRVRMQAPRDLAPYILKKGYIAIDGTSLTITEADPTTGIFAIMLVPHTQCKIVLPDRAVGDRVNLGEPSADRRFVLSSAGSL